MDNKNNLPLVSISCITYNHAPYIRQCLDGFLMQKTNFKFEVLIHDDASIDGTEEIIREYEAKYPDIIKALYEEENQWRKGRRGSKTFNYPRAKGKYIALCEGDDYWIDPYKLQKQVDFLEKNSEYGLCYTACKVYNQNLNKFRICKSIQLNSNQILIRNQISTLTTCFRKSILDEYLDEIIPKLPKLLMGDLPMWIYFSNVSKLKYLDVITSVYRELESSASHSPDIEKQISFYESSRVCKNFFHDYFNYEESLKVEYNAYINTLILWNTILFNSSEKFDEYRVFISSTKHTSFLLWLYFNLNKLSFKIFSPIGRLVNIIRYRKL